MKTEWTKEELQQLYLERLGADGFRPTIDKDGDVCFKFEGGSFYLRPVPDDPQYHVIVMPGIWTIESEEERVRARVAALKVTGDMKVAKVVIYGNSVWATTELFLPAPPALGEVYERCLRALMAARRSFVEALKEEPLPAHDTRLESLGPRGGHALTCGGGMTIARPALPPDAATEAFEAKFLAWVEGDLHLKPVCHAGTGALYWRVEFKGHAVDIGFVGRLRKPSVALTAGVDWLLRIEEAEPTEFIALVEEQFVQTARIRRRMRDGRIRVQFKSTELAIESLLS